MRRPRLKPFAKQQTRYMAKQVGALLVIACLMIAPSQAQQFPDVPTVSQVQALIQQGQMAEGIAVLDSILARNAGDIGARAWRGIAQFFMQHPKQTLSDLHTANLFGLGGTGQFQYGTLYRMATAHAALGDTDRAMQVLSEVVEGGLHSRDVLLDDANLVAVRAHPDFPHLLEKADRVQALTLNALDVQQHRIDHTNSVHELWTDYFPEYDLTSITHVSVPSNASPEAGHPLLVWLNPEMDTEDKLIVQAMDIWREALPEEWIIAAPTERNFKAVDFPRWMWTSGEGIIVINEVVDYLQEVYAIDPKRIFLGGFGGGGDIVWHFAQAHPDKFAGFISFGGQPGHLDYLKMNTHVVNYRHANMVAVNGTVGRIDPAHLEPYMASAKAIAPNLTWTLLDGTADYDALRVQAPKLATWLTQQKLNPLPDVIDWQTGRVFPKYDDAFWLRIDALTDMRTPGAFEPLALEEAAFFNPGFVWTYPPIMAKAEKGTNIVRLFEGGALEQAGIQRGDFLQSVDGYSLDETSDYIPLNYLYTEGHGRQVPVVYERNGVTGKTTLNFAAPPLAYCFHNSARAPRLEVRKAGNDVHVRADGIARFTLFIYPEHFDVTQGINVFVNGTQKVTSAIVPIRDAILRDGHMVQHVGLLPVSVDEE